MFGWAVPGVRSAPAIVTGFVLLLILIIVKFVTDNSEKWGYCSLEGIMKQAQMRLFGYSTLNTMYSIGTGSLAGALSS